MTERKLPTEAQCQRAIIEAAQMAGWRVHAERTSRTASGSYATAIQGHAGFPDIIMCRGYQLLAIELKRDKTGRMGPGQQEWIDALGDVPGVTAMVVWVPSQQDQFIRALTSRQR